MRCGTRASVAGWYAAGDARQQPAVNAANE